ISTDASGGRRTYERGWLDSDPRDRGCGSGVVDWLVGDGVGAALVRPRDDRVGDEAGACSRHREYPVRDAARTGGLADRPDWGKADDGHRGRGATSAACRNPGALQ